MPQQIELKVSGIDVAIAYANECDQTVTQREIEAYIDRAHAQHPGQVLQSLNLDVDGEDVGKIIGRHGRVIKAIRTLARACAARDELVADVEVIG